MSVTAVFVPGIMGTELQMPNGEVIWPPKVSETVFGYKRIDKLQSPDLRATKIVRNVSCVDIYQPILTQFQQLGYSNSGSKTLLEHPYDWRKDLFDLANQLADRLDTVASDEIVIVAHSMGGLVTRLVLESGQYDNRPFFTKISSFIALATPHNGAPLALARVLGLDKAMGISAADFKTLTENESFPSGYQLLPAPGEDACWDTSNGTDLKPLDYYDPDVAVHLGMNPKLVERAKAVHDVLNSGLAPEHIRYFYFSGAGHKTATRVNVDNGSKYVVFTRDAGDGTVPMWSSLPRPEQKQVVINEHANVFRGLPFKRVFFRLMGEDLGAPQEALGALEAREQETQPLHISLQKPVFNAGEPLEIVISSNELMHKLEGRLVLDRLTNEDRIDERAVASEALNFEGPGILTMSLSMKAPLTAGVYELRFEGDRPIGERVVFPVTI